MRGVIVVLAIIVSLVLYVKTSTVHGPSPDELKTYLQDHSLVVGTEVVNDFQQVYYQYETIRIDITNDNSNNTNPVSSGHYVAWTKTKYGDNQSLVYLYDILTRVTTQISYYGNATTLALDNNHIAWQDQTTNTSTIFYYDGQQIHRLGTDYASLRPAIRGNLVLYAQYISENNWQVVQYGIDTKESKVIVKGDSNDAWPRFDGDKIITNGP